MPSLIPSTSSMGLLRHVIDVSRDALMIIEPLHLVVTDVNHYTCKLLGYEREELIGKQLADVESSLQDVFFWEELKASPQFEGTRIIESEWLTKNGDNFPIEKCVTSFSEDGSVYWIVQVESLIGKKQIEEEQIQLVSQLQIALEATVEGILVVDSNGEVTNMNRRFAELWMVPDEILASRSAAMVVEFILTTLKDSSAVAAKLNAIQEDIELETEDVLALLDGRYVVCVSKPQFLRDRAMGRVFSFRDITAMKNAESELIAARNAAEAASQVKSQFLSQMSHELRTPLNSIIGFSQLLETETTGSTLEQVATISRAGKHLLSVINEILDMAKIEAGKIEVECIPFSPIQTLADISSLIEMQVQEKGLAFDVQYDFPLPATINSDPTRFKQILLNLCTNALKYTERGSISLRVSCEAELLTIGITDSGIGINEQQLKKLFSPFSQADSSTTRLYGGTGLGLYISYQFAQMLGGTITVNSTPGVGSTFKVSIGTGPLEGIPLLGSLAEIQNASVAAPSQIETHHLTGNVLLAEDGPDNQRLICALLRKTGVTVTVVENGKHAIEQALIGNFDLILMDMQMPIMDGMEATSILRQASYDKPIIACTANAMKEDVERYMELGCTDHLSKPIDRDKFFEILHKYLHVDATNLSEANESFNIEELDIYAELSKEFAAGLPDTFKQIVDAAATHDWKTVGFVAHTLKGTAGSFGYPHLTDLAALLDGAIKQGQENAILIALANLKVAMENDLAKLNLPN